ncbi:Oidioi.mRNA.OKI2018_I69.chr2.g4975.t1.cds [Oikopleura dioica]|uniref:Oidioi.mRNA.OKI2018_I69.chr2.g4975.t1.cds n=1 Tax=Oikopleura dioica TaxID=34765 RepID=A0ABN7T2R1_OIKDI|nr:Oidioi.mRNA.OKI2018_I69.chr2.g4975.t1.cds [Oikopleura dioica]
MESELASGTGELYLDSAGWEVKSVMRNVSAHFACYVDQKALTTVTSTASSASTSSSSRPTLSPTTTTSKTTTTPLLTTTTTEEITLGWSYCDSDADKTKILWTTTPIYDGASDQFKDWCVYIPRESRQSGLSVDEHCEQFFGSGLSIHDQNLQNSIERVFREFSEVSVISVGGKKDARNEDFYWQDNSDVDYKKRELNGLTVGTGELVYARANFQNGNWELTKNENTLSHSHFACYQKIPEKEGSAEIIEDYFQPLF